jgi:N-acetyl-gamma-glutamyl-phosphate reductase
MELWSKYMDEKANVLEKIGVAVIGANGYTGAELMRILSAHPYAELRCATSRTHAGRRIAELQPALARLRDMTFCDFDADAVAEKCGVAFLCLPHAAASATAAALCRKGVRVIDLSADFRYTDLTLYEQTYKVKHAAPDLLQSAVYGLPELKRAAIKAAPIIGNPGCYTTCAVLSLYPLLAGRAISPAGIIIDACSGVSGAGLRADTEYSFCELNGNFKAYGVGVHRHTSEIEEKLGEAAGRKITLTFTPHLLPVNRGILETIYCTPLPNVSGADIARIYTQYYGQERFIELLPEGTFPELKHAVNSNRFITGFRNDVRTGRTVIVSALDNLIKGAAGQAVQNMNIMCGFPEGTALEVL